MVMVIQAPPYPLHDLADDVTTLVRWARQQQTDAVVQQRSNEHKRCDVWLEENYFIPPLAGQQRPRRIVLRMHQKVILYLFFEEVVAQVLFGEPSAQTCVYSTIKKSGKTCIAGGVGRWATETWGQHSEVYALANDEEQARGRIYAAAISSIELDPRYSRKLKGIPELWRVIESHATYLPTHSTLKAVSSDYKGEAGSSPVLTLWSELWGYSSEASKRLYSELTPVPTRARSMRYVETYAGYENESGILNDLEDRIKDPRSGSRQLDLDELRVLLAGSGLEWPDEYSADPLPLYVHPQSRTIAYWDAGIAARKMPWQTPAYYSAQAAELTDPQFKRLHFNVRISQTNQFIDPQWWLRLHDPSMPALFDAEGNALSDEPVVIAVDGSVSGDCSAAAILSRDRKHPGKLWHRGGEVWQPSGGPLDYGVTIKPALRRWTTGHIHPWYESCDSHSKLDELGPCKPVKPLNCVQLAYDPYQLHDMMTELRNEGAAWCFSFGQQMDRSRADKQLFDLIRDQNIHHCGDVRMADHLNDCAAKIPVGDNSRLRLVKKGDKSKIDYAVCLSMGSHEALRLALV